MCVASYMSLCRKPMVTSMNLFPLPFRFSFSRSRTSGGCSLGSDGRSNQVVPICDCMGTLLSQSGLKKEEEEEGKRGATSEFNAEFFSLHAKLGLQATMLNGESR